jgi:phosphatidylinositol alpha-1,6-mannosyltransferase
MQYVLRHVEHVVANSDFTRTQLIALGVPPERIVLIPPGVDVDVFRPGLPCDDLREQLALGPESKLILSVGRLSERKGFDQVVRALPALRSSGIDAHFALIGIGEDMARLRSLVADLGIGAYTHFLGHVEPDDLPRWYNACDVFAMPNREVAGDTEGFGIVYLEAAACAKPAVAGIAGGTGSAVLHGITGLRVDGTSQKEVETALFSLLADSLTAERLGSNALERVMREFSWGRVADQTAKVSEVAKL